MQLVPLHAGYAEWDFDAFGANCSLNDTIVSFNPAYYTMVRERGGGWKKEKRKKKKASPKSKRQNAVSLLFCLRCIAVDQYK
jgi:hypothetical protein